MSEHMHQPGNLDSAERVGSAHRGSSRWNDQQSDYEVDDDDEGMFSFARPATRDHSSAPAGQSFPSNLFGTSSPPSHLSSNPFSFALPPSIDDSRNPLDYSRPLTANPSAPPPALSPAAAYALENYSSPSGPRKRTSFSAPDSPSHTLGNPYERRIQEEEDLHRSSTRSSRDKIESLDATWAEEPNLSYALTPDGQAIMLNEMGEPIRLATSREQKMLENLGVGDFVPYQSEPEYEEEEDSPYPEVRASVSNIDDPEMPSLTFRVW
ncbi:hypothetical protein JCM5350_007212, partial [Sporobolomyces pararoseus]